MEEKLSADDNVATVLTWIKDPDDTESTLAYIENKISPKGRYTSYAQWFLDASEFKAWSKGFLPLEHENENENRPQQVSWLNGPYGTGKTTAMFVPYPYLMIFVLLNLNT
jgi:hypothetical protein